jgi:hypothetical protein
VKLLVRTLALWLALVALVWLLLPDAKRVLGPLQNTVMSWLLPVDGVDALSPVQTAYAWLLAPALAAWLTVLAIAVLPSRSWLRVLFWTVTSAGWFAAFVVAEGRAENGAAGERALIAVSFAFALGIGGRLGWKARASLTKRAFAEAAVGFAVFVVLLCICGWRFEAGTRAAEAQARARWAKIGLPMEEFDRTHLVGRENGGSPAARQAFDDVLGCDLYKAGSGGSRGPTSQATSAGGTVGDVDSRLPRADDFVFPPAETAALAPFVPKLEAAYRGILAVEPPGWNSDPADGVQMTVPSFLGARVFAQIAVADSLRRISLGDLEGAARAQGAVRRLGAGLRKSPPLVSLMISVALDALLTRSDVRMPAEGDGFGAIAKDADDLRARFLAVNQMEHWNYLRMMASPPFGSVGLSGYLPRWAERIVDPLIARRLLAVSVLAGAGHTEVIKSPETLRRPDFGASLHEAVGEEFSNGGWFAFNPARGHMRIYATLLLREQAEMIRAARARWIAGQPLESRDSVVLPSVRWEITASSEKDSVTLRLVGTPDWIANNTVTPPEFWLLPLDGSAPWQFAAVAK